MIPDPLNGRPDEGPGAAEPLLIDPAALDAALARWRDLAGGAVAEVGAMPTPTGMAEAFQARERLAALAALLTQLLLDCGALRAEARASSARARAAYEEAYAAASRRRAGTFREYSSARERSAEVDLDVLPAKAAGVEADAAALRADAVYEGLRWCAQLVSRRRQEMGSWLEGGFGG